jgi:hypothetical protein
MSTSIQSSPTVRNAKRRALATKCWIHAMGRVAWNGAISAPKSERCYEQRDPRPRADALSDCKTGNSLTSVRARELRVASRRARDYRAWSAFADGCGVALGRAGANVAGHEQARDVGLEQVVHARGWAGQDGAFRVAADGVVEPLRARKRAEEKEGRLRFTGHLGEQSDHAIAACPASMSCLTQERDG